MTSNSFDVRPRSAPERIFLTTKWCDSDIFNLRTAAKSYSTVGASSKISSFFAPWFADTSIDFIDIPPPQNLQYHNVFSGVFSDSLTT